MDSLSVHHQEGQKTWCGGKNVEKEVFWGLKRRYRGVKNKSVPPWEQPRLNPW